MESEEIVVDNVWIDQILSSIHSDRHIELSDVPLLSRIVMDENFQNLVVEHVLKGGVVGEYMVKVLHATCLQIGKNRGAYILARFIFFAKTRDELINFVSLAMTLTPFFPSLMTVVVQRVLETAAKEPIEAFNTPKNVDGKHEDDLLRARFIFNLLTLLKWQKSRDSATLEELRVKQQEEDLEDIKYLGISLLDLNEDFRELLMTWGLRYVEEVGRRQSLCEASIEVIDAFLSLMRVVQPNGQIRLQHPRRLLRQFCALIIRLLKLVNKDDFGTKFDRVDFVYRCYALTGIFFAYILGANKNSLITTLFDEAFENCASIFGTSENISRVYPDIVNYEQYATAGLLSSGFKSTNSAYSCLRELRSSPFVERNAAAMAHSGVLSSRHRKTLESRIGESETLRILIFMHMVENLCMPNEDIYDFDTYRHLGSVLTEKFCQDGITAAFSWSEWKTEREFVAKYVEISKKMDSVPFVNDFLLMLADVGISGVFYILPMVKAYFAATLIQLETTPLKDSKVSLQALSRIAQMLAIFIVAKFLPKIMELLYEILREVTNHEACVLLTHFWNLLQCIVPDSMDEILRNKTTANDFLHSTTAGKDFVSMIVLVVQRNIEHLSGFLPLVMDAFAHYSEKVVSEMDEEDWR